MSEVARDVGVAITKRAGADKTSISHTCSPVEIVVGV
jgi:hypothetical protein